MNRNLSSIIAAFTMVTLLSCGEKKPTPENQSTTATDKEKTGSAVQQLGNISFTNEQTGMIFQYYQQLRMALVNSKAGDAKQAAMDLANHLEGEGNGLKTTAMAMAETNSLEDQRTLFSALTENVEPLFKASISEGTVYKQFCPMAFDGNGGYWLSSSEEIRNPYYGDRMLTCGTVTETIK
jgi:predicted small lipoprotein YifL